MAGGGPRTGPAGLPPDPSLQEHTARLGAQTGDPEDEAPCPGRGRAVPQSPCRVPGGPARRVTLCQTKGLLPTAAKHRLQGETVWDPAGLITGCLGAKQEVRGLVEQKLWKWSGKSAGHSQCARPAVPCTRSAPSVLLLLNSFLALSRGGSLLGASGHGGLPTGSLCPWLEKALGGECPMARDQPSRSLTSCAAGSAQIGFPLAVKKQIKYLNS